MSSSEDSEDNEYNELTLTPPEIQEAARAVVENFLPPKSKEKYLKTYENFVDWKDERKSKSFSENVFLAYSGELAKKVKPTTLWVIYSMLKCTVLMKHNVNLKQYANLTSMLKRQSDGYKCKKTKVFTASNVKKFLFQAPDIVYLDVKVILIFGIFGACRCNEITNITLKDVENHDNFISVTLRDTKTKIDRTFVIRDESANIVQKNIALRPADVQTDRFFLNYRNNKCTKQVIGRHKIAAVPKAIATYLNLPNPEYYTGYCFRRSSATVLADTRANLIALKRHGGRKSDRVAENYIEESIENKSSITRKINESIQSRPSTSDQSFEIQNDTEHRKTTKQQTSFSLELSQTNIIPGKSFLDHEIGENKRERCCTKFEDKLKKSNEKRARDKENNAQVQETGTTDIAIKEENKEVTDPLIVVPTESTIDMDVPLKSEILVFPVQNDQEPVDSTKYIDVPIKTDTLEIPDEDDHESIDLTKDEDVAFNTNTFALASPTNDNQLNKNDVIHIKSFHIDESNDQNVEEDNNENISQETTQEKTQIEKETLQDEVSHDAGAPQSDYYRHKYSIIHIKNFPSENTYNSIFILKGLLTCETGAESKFKYTEVKKNNEVATDLLLQFESHKEAVTACKLLDGMTFHGNKLEVSMGYTFNKNIIAKDLQCFEHKRKLIHDSDRETEQTYKKVRTEISFPPSTPVEAVDHRTAPTELCHETFELRHEFINSLGIKPPFTHRIIVSNIHSSVTEAKLLEVFSLAGDVKKVYLFTDVNKLHQDQGKIEYDHPLEAIQAISMFNKHKLYNQEMVVQMDKSQEEYPLPQGLSSVGQGLGINGLPLRGARIQAEMQKIHKTFVEFGMMEISNDNFNLDERRNDFIIPFKYSFNKCACVNVPEAKTIQNSDDNSSPLAKTSARSQLGDHNYCSKRVTKHSRSSIERDSRCSRCKSSEEKEHSSKDREKKDNRRSRDREEQYSNSSEEEQPSRESEEPGHIKNSEMVVFNNLPPSTTSQSLMKRMRVIGEVIVCDVTDDRRAFLRFAKSQDADRCIRLFHRAKLDGHVIEAKFL